MEIKEQNARIWRRDVEGRNGTFYKYSIGISKKKQDGTNMKTYLDVMFSKKSGAPEKIPNGATCDIAGFLSVDGYTNRDGKKITRPLIIVMTADFKDGLKDNDPKDLPDNFQQAEDDMPFK